MFSGREHDLRFGKPREQIGTAKERRPGANAFDALERPIDRRAREKHRDRLYGQHGKIVVPARVAPDR